MSTKNIGNLFSDFSIEGVRDFVEKYILQIIYIVCLITLVLFLSVYMINRKTAKKTELIANYYQAVNEIKNDKNDIALEILKDVYNSKYADENIKTISGIKMADILLLNGKKEEAIQIYGDIYSLKNNDEFLRNLSGLTKLSILINENDQKNYSKIDELIKDLKSTNNPLILLVNEQEGIFEIQKGNNDKGIEILKNVLLEEDVDEDTKSRINLILELYENSVKK